MEHLTDDFGLSRVIEPANAVPVTAWKVDNSREIKPEECRISLSHIHLERDNFQQLCSECGFDEGKIIAKILDVINRRGKLHNPFTNTAGQFYGIIEEMGTVYAAGSPYQVGEEILCLTSMSAHPIHIDKIHEIDYNYGEILVSGYGILFMGSPLTKVPRNLKLNYTMTAMDEAGSIPNIYKLARWGERHLIIGKDLMSTVIYAYAVREVCGPESHITVILDESSINSLSRKAVQEELDRWSDSAYILDLSLPMESAEYVLAREPLYDFTVNCEDMLGSETLSVLLTRNKGRLCFTSIKNGHAQSILFAESFSRELETFVLNQYIEGCEIFTFNLLEKIRERLDSIDERLRKYSNLLQETDKKAALRALDKTIKADDFIFASPVTEALVDEVLNIANYDCNIIIQGETGVGKEKILGLIHKNGVRRGKPCVKINCATIQENLAESEFFGYEPGSFTGAQSSGKIGYFEAANGGILFLDEAETLSLSLQSKLLRVLQENQFYKVGGTAPVSINVQVICASNVPLRQLTQDGRFREDLFYRLNICAITVPPLRDRREDIPVLAQTFLENYCKRYGTDKELDPSALTRMAAYDWPGNVRELENLVHRSFINVRGHIITGDDIDAVLNESIYEDLVINVKQEMRSAMALDFNRIINQQEAQLIEYALKKCGSTRKAAVFLNMTQAQIMRKKQKYNIP